MQIEIPTKCPACDYPLETVNEQLFCRNTACSARLDKMIEHFAKTLSIKGLGAKSVEKLNLADITELFYLDEDSLAESLGSSKLAEKLLGEIDKARSAGLEVVLASFGIPLIGGTASSKICSVVSHIDEINAETCKLAGLGAKATNNLLTFLETDFMDMREFLPFSFAVSSSKSSSINCKSVCITGKLSSFKNKAEAGKALEEAGFKVVDSVTKTTDYLVDEENKQSSKRTKAESLGIPIISNLISFIKENTND